MTTYKHAPLKYVVFELQISPSAVLGERESVDKIHGALSEDLPVREDVGGGLVPSALAGLVQTSGARFVDVGQHTAVVIAPNRIGIDTTTYTTFQDFFELIKKVLDSVAAVAPGRACRRLGLRYVDEIRIPGTEPGQVDQWREWIDNSLLAASASRPVSQKRDISGVIDDTLEGGYGVRFAWHTGTGYAVQPHGPLLVPNPAEPGPYFALDTDSYWSADGMLPLGSTQVIERIAELHVPVRNLFETSITDRLRNDILIPLEET